MKLYTAANSNFGARVALAARAKGVALVAEPLPAGGLKSAAFLAINPIAKIPVLVLDDGAALPESEVILRYLEARFPEPSLLPPVADEKARIDLACRVLELYVIAPVIRLFPHLSPASRDARVVADEVARWRDGLAVLAQIMATPLPSAPSTVSLADCMLLPALHLSTRIAAMLDLGDDPCASHPALIMYYRGFARHPIAGPVLEDLTLAQAEKDAQHGLPMLTEHHRSLAGLN